MKVTKFVRVAALTATGRCALAQAASAHPQPIRLVNHAGLTGHQVASSRTRSRE